MEIGTIIRFGRVRFRVRELFKDKLESVINNKKKLSYHSRNSLDGTDSELKDTISAGYFQQMKEGGLGMILKKSHSHDFENKKDDDETK